MRYTLFEQQKDVLILLARLCMMLLFVIAGWDKLMDFSGTVAYMASTGAPFPTLATVIATGMELFVSLALVLGVWTRPLAVLYALYTLGTVLIGHHFWTLTGEARIEDASNFYKNIAIIGGLLLLCVAGPGKYSLDKK